MKPICVLCAKSYGDGILVLWVMARGLDLRGTCAHCGYVSATVPLIIKAL